MNSAVYKSGLSEWESKAELPHVYVQEVKSLQMENESLKLTLDKVQVQLDTSLDAQVNK